MNAQQAASYAVILLVIVILVLLGIQFLDCYNSPLSELGSAFSGQSKTSYCLSQLP